jgi:2-polyprenyl-3-methyl-5-hydroxy-6-metoxy-1,4-benzoquinol methylase
MKRFNKEVIKAVIESKNEIKPFLEKLDFKKISKHNCAYLEYAQNPVKKFIDWELIRYFHTIDFIYSTFPKSATILDIGFFIPIIPMSLSKLGYKVCAIEKLSYYQGALDEIIAMTTNNYNIELLNFDLIMDMTDNLKLRFDIILLLAVLEHLNGTPRYLLDKTKLFLKSDGNLIVEVPNIASLTKRVAFFKKGIPPLQSFEEYYNSDYPFSGHNREYTIKDLKYALDHSGFDVIRLDAFHHSSVLPDNLKGKVLYAFEALGPSSWKPNIWVVAKPRLD